MPPSPTRFVHAFDELPAISPDARRDLLGGKGANLATMVNDLGLPVPPGFTITTEACRAFIGGRWPEGLDDEIRAQMDRLGAVVGKRFGDPVDPLLVSVRSGAPVSMPGMMDTILNLGLTPASVPGLAAASDDSEFASDCLRRLREGYREVIGSDDLPEDPWVQLRAAIEAVFRSWNSDRARSYRRHEGIPDDVGTAVVVQAMVFGNRGTDSGTGVLFTRNPSTGEPELYGDIMFEAQGEDVVAGGHQPQPLQVLADAIPGVAEELRRHAELLERHYADMCDIEFTIERGRLWLLQVRVGKRSPRAALRIARDMADEDGFPLSRSEAVQRVLRHLGNPPRIFLRAEDAEPIATGLPASPGVATGAIVTSSDAAEVASAAGKSVILVRSETSPDDVRGIASAAGVLTSLGGLASHAAVVARGWGIPAVVGARAVRPGADSVEVAGRSLAAGDVLTVDGGSGEIFMGELAGHWDVAPEVAELLAWAADLGIEPTAGEVEAVEAEGISAAGSDGRPLTADDVLRALFVKGSVSPDDLGTALMVSPAEIDPLVAELLAEGALAVAKDALQLTGEGRLRADELFAADRRDIGAGRTSELLDEFHAFDLRMKDIVTAWQVREIAGEQVLNDHVDAEYDAEVLDRLVALHEELDGWLDPIGHELWRHAMYRSRLGAAARRAREGDQRFVASPRVDSYHSVWFELHEDLIRLAGRRRSDEAAAGRA